MPTRHQSIIFASLAGLLAVLTACGGEPRGEVAGQVTIDDQSVDGGEIRFLPNVGIPSFAQIVDGRYHIPIAKGPSTGPVRVEIRWIRKTGRKLPAMPPAPKGTMIEETAETIPARYNLQSELTCDIAPGLNTCDFALETKSAGK